MKMRSIKECRAALQQVVARLKLEDGQVDPYLVGLAKALSWAMDESSSSIEDIIERKEAA